MTSDRAIELLRGMQASLLNGGRLRSVSSVLDASRVEAMDVAIEAIRAEIGTGNPATQEPASSVPSAAQK